MNLDRRGDQGSKPSRCGRTFVSVPIFRGTRYLNRHAVRVLHGEADVADRPQLCRQRLQELLRANLLLGEAHRVPNQQLREAHRRSNLHASLHAGAQDCHAAGEEDGEKIDQDEDNEELHPKRAGEPPCM